MLFVPARLIRGIDQRLAADETAAGDPDNHRLAVITLPIALGARGARSIVTAGASRTARPDRTLISALRRAHTMIGRDAKGPIMAAAPGSQYARRLASLALLAPDIQRDILAGLQPPRLTLTALMAVELPLDWNAQRRQFGWQA